MIYSRHEASAKLSIPGKEAVAPRMGEIYFKCMVGALALFKLFFLSGTIASKSSSAMDVQMMLMGKVALLSAEPQVSLLFQFRMEVALRTSLSS